MESHRRSEIILLGIERFAGLQSLLYGGGGSTNTSGLNLDHGVVRASKSVVRRNFQIAVIANNLPVDAAGNDCALDGTRHRATVDWHEAPDTGAHGSNDGGRPDVDLEDEKWRATDDSTEFRALVHG